MVVVPMDISHEIAAALGFPKPKYGSVERERRWLCRDVPREPIAESDAVTGVFVGGTRLRRCGGRPWRG
jgi:hypothetical protein